MNFDLILPGTILALKFIFKIAVDQQVTPTGLMKAFLQFPIDLSFLTLTFGAAVLTISPPPGNAIKGAMVFVLIAVLVSAMVQVLCKFGDRLFDDEKRWRAVGVSAVSYVIAGAAILSSMLVPGFML